MEGALDTSMSTAGCSQDQQGIADFVTTNSLYTGALDQSMHQDEHVLRERRRLLALDSVKVDIQRKESIINTLQQRIHSLESDILKSNEIIKETHRQWAEEQDQLVDEKASLQKRFEEKEIEHEIERTNLNQFIGKLQDELRDYRETTGAKIFLLDGENSSMRSQVASLQEQIRGIEDDHKKTRNQLKKSKEAFVDTEKNQLEANRSLAEMNILLERTTKELQAASKESKKQIKAAEKWKLSYQKLEESAKVAFENAASKHGRMMDSAKRDISRYKQQETSMKKVLGKVLSAVSAPLTDLNLTLGDNDKDTEHNDENDVNAASRIQQLCIVMNKLSEFLTTLSEEGDSGDEAPTASKAKKPVNLFVNVLISLLSRLTSSLQSRAKLEDLSSNATNAIKVAQLMMTKQETRMSNAMHFVHGITKLAADMSKELQDCQLSLQPDAPFREGTRSPHIRSKNGDGIEPKHGVFSPLSNRSASASPKRSERGFASKTPSPQRSQLQKAMQSPIRPHSASDPLPTSPWMSPTNWTFITELGENFMHGVDVAEASMGRGEDASVVRMQYCQSAIDTLRAHMQEVIQGASRCHRNYYELNTAYEDLQLRYERLQDTQAKETAENDKLLGDISADLNECKEKYMKEQDRFDALKKWSKQEISAANLLLKKAKCRDDAQMKDRESLLKQLSLVQDTYQQTIDRLQTELDDVRSHYESFIGDMQKTHKIAMKDQREEYRAKLAVHGAAHDERVRKEVIDQRLTNQEIIHQQEMTLLQERYETEMSVALKEAILRKNVTGTQQQDDDLENEKCHEEVIAHLQCWVQHLIYSGLVKSQTLYELATQKSYLAQVVHRYEMLRCDVQAVYEGCFMSLSTGSINNLEHVDTHADLLQRGDIYETSRRTRTPHELEMFHDQRKSPVRRLPGLSAYQKRTTIPTLRVVAIAILVARRFENVLKDMRCPPDELDFLGAMAVGQYSVTKGRPLDTLPRPHMPMLKSDGYFHIPDVEILNTLPTESGAEIILDASMKQLCEEIMHSPQRKERFMYAHPLLGHDRLEMHGRSLLRTVASASNRYSASDTPCGTSQMSLRRPFWYEQRPARSYFGGDQIHGICVTLESMSRALREHSDNDAALKVCIYSTCICTHIYIYIYIYVYVYVYVCIYCLFTNAHIFMHKYI
jgi:hypothetical protein